MLVSLLLLLLSRFSHVRLCATHRQQYTKLPRPWDSPGKNTGLGCHFLLQCMKVKSESEVAQHDSLRPHGLQPTRLLHPWDFPGKSTGVGCHCLLWLVSQLCPTLCDTMDCSPPSSSVHGVLQTRILERVANPFSRVSSRLRGQTPVSCIAGRFFTI